MHFHLKISPLFLYRLFVCPSVYLAKGVRFVISPVRMKSHCLDWVFLITDTCYRVGMRFEFNIAFQMASCWPEDVARRLLERAPFC